MKEIFSSPDRPDCLWGSSSLPVTGYWGRFPEVKRPERDVGHSRRSSAEAENELSFTSAPPICLHVTWIGTALPLTAVLCAFAKLRKATVSFDMSVHPHGTGWLPPDRFS